MVIHYTCTYAGAPIPFVVLPAVLLGEEYYDDCDTKVLVTI